MAISPAKSDPVFLLFHIFPRTLSLPAFSPNTFTSQGFCSSCSCFWEALVPAVFPLRAPDFSSYLKLQVLSLPGTFSLCISCFIFSVALTHLTYYTSYLFLCTHTCMNMKKNMSTTNLTLLFTAVSQGQEECLEHSR